MWDHMLTISPKVKNRFVDSNFNPNPKTTSWRWLVGNMKGQAFWSELLGVVHLNTVLLKIYMIRMILFCSLLLRHILTFHDWWGLSHSMVLPVQMDDTLNPQARLWMQHSIILVALSAYFVVDHTIVCKYSSAAWSTLFKPVLVMSCTVEANLTEDIFQNMNLWTSGSH